MIKVYNFIMHELAGFARAQYTQVESRLKRAQEEWKRVCEAYSLEIWHFERSDEDHRVIPGSAIQSYMPQSRLFEAMFKGLTYANEHWMSFLYTVYNLSEEEQTTETDIRGTETGSRAKPNAHQEPGAFQEPLALAMQAIPKEAFRDLKIFMQFAKLSRLQPATCQAFLRDIEDAIESGPGKDRFGWKGDLDRRIQKSREVNPDDQKGLSYSRKIQLFLEAISNATVVSEIAKPDLQKGDLVIIP